MRWMTRRSPVTSTGIRRPYRLVARVASRNGPTCSACPRADGVCEHDVQRRSNLPTDEAHLLVERRMIEARGTRSPVGSCLT